MKNKLLYFLLSALAPSLSMGQADYHTGVFNGPYLSTYPNGKTKASGLIEKNQRVGDWTFYDESGDLVAKIHYTCNTEFQTLETRNQFATTLDIPLNAFDKLFQIPLEEENVVWAQRMFRDIPVSEFKPEPDFQFFDFLETIPTDNPLCYADDQFQTKIEDIRRIKHRNEPISGYRIKVDYFIRKDFNFMDFRIVGIAPLYQTSEGKNAEICWLYYHELKDLVFEKIVNKEGKSMETILQTRDYHSTIYKENSVSNKALEDIAPDETKRKALYREIDQSLIETENNYILTCYF